MQQRRTKSHQAAHPNPPQVTATAESVSPDPPIRDPTVEMCSPLSPSAGGHPCDSGVRPKRDVTTTCPACLHPTPKEVALQGHLPLAAAWTRSPPAWATCTKPERNLDAAGYLLNRHTQSSAVLGVGKLRHIRLACSHQAVCSNMKKNTSPCMQNIKHVLFPDLGMPPVKTGGSREVFKALLPAQ